MASDKIRIIRKVFAWVVGILVFFFGFHINDYIGFSDDSFASMAILILGIMIGARIGMAIYTGKLNGGVSPEKNRLFFLFIIFIIIMGIIGTISQVLLDEIFGKKSLWQILIAIPFSLSFGCLGIFLAQKLGILRRLGL